MLVSNINQASAAVSGFSVGLWRAVGFTTGSNATGYSLESIDFRFVNVDNESNPGRFRAELWSATSEGKPDTKQKTLMLSSSYTAGIRAATAPTGTTLQPNTKYFAVLYVVSGPGQTLGAQLQQVSGTITPTRIGPGWAIDSPIYASSYGASWSQGSESHVPAIRVNGAAVPAQPA